MTFFIENTKTLLQVTRKIADHQEEIKRLRGESFNVFSILKMESRENDTHSAFLGELLNPHGSHLKGSLFLKLFLKTIKYEGGIDLPSAQLILEKSIGARNDELKKGGRVDIFIYDAKGNSICIENKIYASDQNCQVERYINYNKALNTVYYLTRNGDEAPEFSRGQSTTTTDYFRISYRETIISWLSECLKESVDQPILRESIRQYILLLKKMTHQLSDTEMEQIQDLICANYSAAKYVQSNVARVERDIVYKVLNDIKGVVEKALDIDWKITVDQNLYDGWTGIRLDYNKWDEIYIRLQGDSSIIGGMVMYGIVAHKDTYDRSIIDQKLSGVTLLNDGYKSIAHWPRCKRMDLFTFENIERFFDTKYKDEMIEMVSSLLIGIAQASAEPLSSVKKLPKM
jgi:hypothetical protein